MIFRVSGPLDEPTCADCGNVHVRPISPRAFSRKVYRGSSGADSDEMLQHAARPGALLWTCDRCGDFGVSALVVEDSAQDHQQVPGA